MLTGKSSGELVTIDKGVLREIDDLLAAAIGAIIRANTRVGGVKAERRCTAAIFATGVAPDNCPTAAPAIRKDQ